jgi:hypothetical protein
MRMPGLSPSCPTGAKRGAAFEGVAGAIANIAWSRIVHLPPTEGSLIGSIVPSSNKCSGVLRNDTCVEANTRKEKLTLN